MATTNTLITPDIVAREALIALENNLVMAGLVHRDYSDEFKQVGDTVTIRKPAVFEAKTFTSATDPQNVTETSIDVKLDTHLDVTFALGVKELTLDIVNFRTQFIDPAMRAHAQAIDLKLCNLYKGIPSFYGTAATTPDALEDIAGVRKMLNDQKVPMGERRLVIDSTAEAEFLVLDAIINAEKSGTTEALRNANLGRLMGFGVYMDQNIRTHDSGGDTACAIDNKGTAYAVGATAIHVDGLSAAMVAGDAIKVGSEYYSIASVGTLDTADQDLVLGEPIRTAANFVDDVAVTVLADHTANMAFHRNALALVTRPLAPPLGAARAEVLSWNGISVRVVYAYDSASKVDTISLDLLCGAKVIYPELACRLLG